jgi:ComF family protein
VVTRLFDVLFPPRCVGCGSRGRWICDACRHGLPLLSSARCRRCATPLIGVSTCRRCWSQPPAFETVTCAFAFDGTVRQAIHRLKYDRARHLAGPLVDAALDVGGTIPDIDLVVPIPLHPVRRAQRGFNQSVLLAEHLSKRLALPLDDHSLTRVRDTPAQVSVPPARRWDNVRGAFELRGSGLADRRVLLVDDVATSASTLRAAAAAVARGGARQVDAFVIARAVGPDPGSGTRVALPGR